MAIPFSAYCWWGSGWRTYFNLFVVVHKYSIRTYLCKTGFPVYYVQYDHSYLYNTYYLVLFRLLRFDYNRWKDHTFDFPITVTQTRSRQWLSLSSWNFKYKNSFLPLIHTVIVRTYVTEPSCWLLRVNPLVGCFSWLARESWRLMMTLSFGWLQLVYLLTSPDVSRWLWASDNFDLDVPF